MGMPVVVVPAGADQGDLRPDRGEERGVGGGAAVVRDLEGTRTQRGRGLQQGPQRLLFGVPGEQDPLGPVVHPQHQRHLVGLPVAAHERAATVRREHVHGQPTDRGTLTRDRLVDRDAAGRSGCAQARLLGRARLHGSQPHGPDRHVRDHGRQAHGMIGVRMAEHHQVQ